MFGSSNVDEKVLMMTFENKQFEKELHTSLSSIDKLKKSLDFSGAGKGLDEVGSTVSRMNMNPLIQGLEIAHSKFSALEIMGITALQRITNQAIDTGERLVKSLSVDQINAGWSKYAEKTSSVQTIMAATSKDFTDTGEQMKFVNAQLEKLNWFTDETSYNFLDMVNNIGKFTSNQIPLDQSVTAMQGISTWAARSGANIGEAGRAMYNLSQAIATGSVKLIDWKSIENANMATAEFKENVIETALEMGTLKKEADGTIHTLVKKDHIVSVKSFNEELKDAWFTSDVLLKTLEKYGGFTDVLYEFSDLTGQTATDILMDLEAFQNKTLDMNKVSHETGLSVAELTEWYKKLGDETMSLGQKSFRAAQEAKTFQEAIDATKDAVSTGWMNTFEIIFGDYQKAKVLWTDLANTLYDVFAESGNARNELLSEALTSNWDIFTGELTKAGVAYEDFEKKVDEVMSRQSRSLPDIIQKYGSLEKAIQAGALETNVLKNAFNELWSSRSKGNAKLDDIIPGLKKGAINDSVKEIQNALKTLNYDIGSTGVDGIIGDFTESAIRKFQEDNGLDISGIIDEKTLGKLKELTAETDFTADGVLEIIDAVDKLGGREMIFESIANVWNALLEVLGPVKEGFRAIFPAMTAERLYDLIDGIHTFTESLSPSQGTLKNIRMFSQGIFAAFDIVKQFAKTIVGVGTNMIRMIFPGVSKGLLDIAGKFGQNLVHLDRFIKKNDVFGQALVKTTAFLADYSKHFLESIKHSERGHRVYVAFHRILRNLSGAWKDLKEKIFGTNKETEASNNKLQEFGKYILGIIKAYSDKGLDKLVEWFEKLSKIDFKTKLMEGYEYLITLKNAFLDWLSSFGQNGDAELSTSLIDTIIERFKGLKSTAEESLNSVSETVGTFWVKFKEFLSNFDMGTILAIGLAGSLIYFLVTISNAVKSIKGAGGAIKRFFVSFRKGFEKCDNIGDIAIKMAGAMAILTAALIALSYVPADKIDRALVQIGLLAGGIVTVAAVLGLLQKFDMLGDFKSIGLGMAAISAGVFLLALSMKSISEIPDDKLLNSLFTVGILMTGLAGVAIVLSTAAPKLASGSIFLIAFSFAVKNLVGAMLELFEIAVPQDWGSRIAVLLSMVATLSGLALAAGQMKLSSAVGMTVLIVSIKMFVKALEDIGGFDVDKFKTNLGAYVTVFGLLSIIAIGLGALGKYTGDGMMKAGVGILAMIFALEIIVDVIKKMGKIDDNSARQGLAAVTVIFACFAAIMGLSKFAGPNAAKAGVGILAMSIAVGLLVLTIKQLGKMDPSVAAKGIMAIGALSVIFGVLMVFSKFAGGSLKTLIGLSIAIATLAASMVVLSLINPEKLIRVSKSLSLVMLALSAAIAATNIGKAGVTNVAALVILIGGISAALAILSGITDPESLLKVATSISMVMGAVALTMVALTAVGAAGPAALVGVLEVAAVFTAILGICSLFDDFSEQLQPILNNGLPLLIQFSEGIGEALGAFIGGIGLGIANQLPAIGEKLSEFTVKLGPFIDIMGSEKMQNASGGVSALATLIGAVAKLEIAEFLNRLLPLREGEAEWDFGSKLANLAGGLNTFAEATADLDQGKLGKASDALDTLVEIMRKIPNSKGLLPKITGYKDFNGFGDGLKHLGAGVADFAIATQNMPTDGIKPATDALTLLVDMSNRLPQTDGLVQKVTGEIDYEGFGTGLGLLADGIVSYAGKVQGIKTSDVKSSAKAIGILSDLSKELPKEGGLSSWIFGDTNIAGFGQDMSDFADGIKEYYLKFGSISLPRMTEISTMLLNLTTTLNGFDGANTAGALNFSYILQNLNVDALTTLAESLNFGTITHDIGNDAAASLVEGYSLGMSLQNESIIATTDLFAQTVLTEMASVFRSKTGMFQMYGVEFMNKLVRGMSSRLSHARSAAMAIINYVKNALSSASAFSEGVNLANTFIIGINSKYNDVRTAGEYLVQGVLDGIDRKDSVLMDRVQKLGEDTLKNMKEGMDEHSPSHATTLFGEYLVRGAINGVDNLTNTALSKAFAFGKKMVNAITEYKDEADFTNIEESVEPRITPMFNLKAVRDQRRKLQSYTSGAAMSAEINANLSRNDMIERVDKLIDHTTKMCNLLANGSDVYLNENVLVGRMNRRLGAMLG